MLLVALVGDGVGDGVGVCFKPNFVLVSLGFLLICSAPTGLSINSNYKNESSQTQLPILGSGCLCNRWGQGSGCVTKSSDGAQRPYSVPVLTAPSCPHSREGAYLRRKQLLQEPWPPFEVQAFSGSRNPVSSFKPK